jgi:hypothetical protein
MSRHGAGAAAAGTDSGDGVAAEPLGAPLSGGASPSVESGAGATTSGASRAISRSKPQLSQNRPLAGAPQSGQGVGPVPPSGVVIGIPADVFDPASADDAAPAAPDAAETAPDAAETEPDAIGATRIGVPHSSQ